MKRVLTTVLLFCVCSSAFATTYSSRNSTAYLLGQYASHTITTHPAQPYSAVYSWRTHVKFDGDPGPLGYNGDIIGYTDGSGALIIEAIIANDPVYCGTYHAERVAVGSPTNPKSNYINFKIEVGLIGPRPPWFNQCREGTGTGGGSGGGGGGTIEQ
ncbi:hypothetical protein [Arenicella xantha]|uniref:Uncharacterized protein n=1 Tax=Arenicella xantha TaxID=644221 RepID=A0A395JKG9_9GAMM|nr:hypothetical protein [Arenicella xantha]RBP51252.1 hypothetical protein DFR28_102671 [Arenicella xantha]